MAKPVKITEVVLRDAHQSLLATRMTMDEMRPILPAMDEVGYYSVECWGGATFDACIRFLDEDPWDRLRILRKEMPNTKLQMLLRGQNLLGYKHYHDDVVEKFIELSIKNGIDIIRIFDALNDFRNCETALNATMKYATKNTIASGCICYTQSPVHTVEKYVEMCKELKRMGFQTICLKGISEVAHIYGKGRVQTPLKRVGERGSGQFEPISWDEALDEVAFARARGQRVYVETCPQYLALDDGVYYDANWSMAARYVCAPPIRAEENQRALWRGLRRGEIQTISTDHCSFTLAQKDMGREDFTKIPGGLPGVETRGEVVYTRGVAAGRMTVAGMCRALCENPAKLYGLYPRKGVIAAGSDADIVVYDPKASHILTARDMVTKAGYTPFEGLRTEGGIAKVYLRGSLMVEDGRIVGGPEGQSLRRGLCTL